MEELNNNEELIELNESIETDHYDIQKESEHSEQNNEGIIMEKS